MYEQLVEAYDLIQAARGKDHAAEAARIADAVIARRPGATTLLDVACGTGSHLVHLRERFEVAGVDLSEAMLEVARRRLPGVPLEQGDMRALDLGRRFDVVTCLFSSIGYVVTVDGLHRAVAAMAAHLAPGGVLVVEPWFRPDEWVPEVKDVYVDAATSAVCAVARASRSLPAVPGPDGALVSEFVSRIVMVWPDRSEEALEHHRMGLFTDAQHHAAFDAAGLVGLVRLPERADGRGALLVATTEPA